MRRTLSALAIGLTALSLTGFTSAGSSQSADEGPMVCVNFQDTHVPGTGITVEKPADNFCYEAPTIRVNP